MSGDTKPTHGSYRSLLCQTTSPKDVFRLGVFTKLQGIQKVKSRTIKCRKWLQVLIVLFYFQGQNHCCIWRWIARIEFWWWDHQIFTHIVITLYLNFILDKDSSVPVVKLIKLLLIREQQSKTLVNYRHLIQCCFELLDFQAYLSTHYPSTLTLYIYPEQSGKYLATSLW